MTVFVQGGNLDVALRLLKKRLHGEGLLHELTQRSDPKKSNRVRQKHVRAVRRRKKEGIN